MLSKLLPEVISATPIQELKNSLLDDLGVRLFVKRIDMNHPHISGNKWFKLKYNLEEAVRQKKKTLLTFGGAYSNHIVATAAAGKALGLKTIGIIRGEEYNPLNPTLSFASHCGMRLHYVTRARYRQKEQADFLAELKDSFGDFYLIPEGGSNVLAVKGCMEILSDVDLPFDTVCCSCGTGGTLTGISLSLKEGQRAIGFSSLKGNGFLDERVEKLIKAFKEEHPGASVSSQQNWAINYDYHLGGYARTTPELIRFIKQNIKEQQLPLDYVYTGKMLFGLYDLIQKGFFSKGETILAIHTGGLQGNHGGKLK